MISRSIAVIDLKIVLRAFPLTISAVYPGSMCFSQRVTLSSSRLSTSLIRATVFQSCKVIRAQFWSGSVGHGNNNVQSRSYRSPLHSLSANV